MNPEATPQIINGEILPLNHYVGRGSCLRIETVSEAIRLEKIDLLAIPTIQTINASFANKGLLKDGTIIGVTTPVFENDTPNLIILDKGTLLTMSIKRYQHKKTTGAWVDKETLVQTQYPKDTIPESKKKKKKHLKPRRRKEKRGRVV